MPFSREKTYESIYYSIIRPEFNVYVEIYFDGDVIISKYKNGTCVANWVGCMKDTAKELKKYFEQ